MVCADKRARVSARARKGSNVAIQHARMKNESVCVCVCVQDTRKSAQGRAQGVLNGRSSEEECRSAVPNIYIYIYIIIYI